MAIKRGTNVEFVGAPTSRAMAFSNSIFFERWFQKQVKYYDDKYGVQLGDKGTVVRAKNGWFRVSWTRQDGTRALSVPMRAYHFTEKPAEEPEADGESSPVRPTSLLYGFEPTEGSIVEESGAWGASPQHIACARLLKSSRTRCSCLEGELADYSASMTELIAELDRVKLRLISARTLMQLKDNTIAELRGAPSFETWGDWVVPEVGSG
jgi:hypothetical protein